MEIYANNPSLQSWVAVSENSDFPIQNLPFGIFQAKGQAARVGVALGEHVIDLAYLHKAGFLDELNIPLGVLESRYLNDLMALGRPAARMLRNRLARLFEQADSHGLQKQAADCLYSMKEVDLLLPVKVGDYTDFYSSRNHAYNIGCLFRDPENALLPNWLHLPVGYHGRASSIVVSGTSIRRPKGQLKPNDEPPVFGASRLLDFELEMAFVVSQSTELGQPVSTAEAEDHIFGMVLFNDWSARDIQKWEYVPLGPFLGKSFASTISPWVVTLDALEPFRIPGPKQEPKVLPYLQCDKPGGFNIELEVAIQPEGQAAHTISRSNFKYMYWNMAQQLAHHTVNGCNINTGDMMASGTISGTEESAYGSMLELTWKGTKPLQMPDGSERKFINDGDTVILSGYAEKNGVRVGFGHAAGKLLAAHP